MTIRQISGLPMLLNVFALVATGRASSACAYLPNTARNGNVTVRSVTELEPATGITVRDLYPEANKTVRGFAEALASHRDRDANAVLRTMPVSDLRDYLFAYRNYSQTSLSQFADSINGSDNSHSYIYKMAALKILIADAETGRLGGGIGRIYRNVPPAKFSSSLGYVLVAENSLFCQGDGLAIARRIYQESLQKFPHIPALWNREAYLIESSGGYRTHKGETPPTAVTKFDLKKAIKLRSQMLHIFPSYEPNYYLLATDYKVASESHKAKEILRSYFRRFTPACPYYQRCRAMQSLLG